MEITGSWAARNHEFLTGDGLPVDFTGIPLNEEGRIRALSYSESQLAMVERQCQGWPPFYFVQGPFGLKIWSETDPLKGNVISYTIGAWEDRAADYDLDGRPASPVPICRAHTGRVHDRRVGRQHAGHLHDTHKGRVPAKNRRAHRSDEATMTVRFYRHGDILTVLAIIEDPIYLAEPWILSRSFQLSATPLPPIGPPCVTTFEGNIGTTAPHYLPEKNPFVDEMTTKYGVPRDAAIGKPETLYPEYRKKIPPAASEKSNLATDKPR